MRSRVGSHRAPRVAHWPGGLALLLASSVQIQSAHAQQAFEIDFDSGRTIIDHEFRSLGYHLVTVDWDSRILYTDDDEEPEGIMAFSLETGEWLRTIRTPEGEGPYEFPYGRSGMALRPGGGFYVSGLLRVVEYDAEGLPVNSWTPRGPMSRAVCAFGGAPVVPALGGVARHNLDGTIELIGPGEAREGPVTAETAEQQARRANQLQRARIACLDGVAYVSRSYDEGPDTVFAYHADGAVDRVPVPLEGAVPGAKCEIGVGRGPETRPCPHWSRFTQLSFDDLGNLVMLGTDMLTYGAIIDPETGCYALIHATTFSRYTPVAVRADSVLVYHNRPIERTINGERHTSWGMGTSPKVAMHALRRISGEPCPGMLPTLN